MDTQLATREELVQLIVEQEKQIVKLRATIATLREQIAKFGGRAP